MIDPSPADQSEAVELLLARCPELESVWTDLCEWMGAATGESIGVFNVFGQIILPLLLFALDGGRGDDDINQRAARQRAQFLERPEWAQMPPRGSEELHALVTRLYEVLDLWAASPNKSLRDAVYIEMIETGYVDLSVQDLLALAGPSLRGLGEEYAK